MATMFLCDLQSTVPPLFCISDYKTLLILSFVVFIHWRFDHYIIMLLSKDKMRSPDPNGQVGLV